MRAPYSRVREEVGKTLLNAGNLCLAATVDCASVKGPHF